MKNGYIVIYYKNQRFVDQELMLGTADVEDAVNAALIIGECDAICIHCVDNGDVLYVRELFFVDGEWKEFNSNQVMNRHYLCALGEGT